MPPKKKHWFEQQKRKNQNVKNCLTKVLRMHKTHFWQFFGNCTRLVRTNYQNWISLINLQNFPIKRQLINHLIS